MIAVACTLLSALGFWFAYGLGEQWWLAWLAPLPVLWYAFGAARARLAFLVPFAAAALGGTSILRAYAELMPPPILALAILAPAATFALAVLGARRVLRVLGPLAATLAFAALWTAFDFLAAFSDAGGAAGSPANSQVAAPLLIQTASLVGFLGITFLLGMVPAGLAASLRTRSPWPACLVLALFAANLGYGAWRTATPPTGALRVALLVGDDATGRHRVDDRDAALAAIDAYVRGIDALRDRQLALIVLPENIARIAPEWRGDAQARLAAAATRVGATLVAGFNTRLGDRQHNVSWAFVPGVAEPVTYAKRRLVPELETRAYATGAGPVVLPAGIGLAICKDMDFQAMLRDDAVQTRPLLLAVPAWDFGADAWAHARVAMLRSVENGVPLARAARDGLLTLNDRYGRIVARATSTGPVQALVGELPLGERGGATPYDRIGDLLGWLCLVVGPALVGWTMWRRR